ncbi:sulfatase-like hydrolase/transferase [Natrinema salsiterrestre]|uniref:Sulfatase-like hydrolase/transferase n=1 Tax=Natrinema salsiterrestre TaxID=2950540 RepID=A0A9Q4KYC3_9EURY|nr:sulfatase-like hydrolase/transferase [Natrinema salsiterrestre]MDF9744126.1 sulfatase-like hydrolase/transferase [Natrinema salsiterrestre]
MSGTATMGNDPSIALVVLDTLRADSFNEHFDWLPGVQFANAWSTSHWTAPAHASLFTGLYASEAGVTIKSQDFDRHTTRLPELLRDRGYRTRAFSCNVNVSERLGWHHGFDEFDGGWRLRGLGENVFDWDAFIADHQSAGPERYLRAVWRCVDGDCDTTQSLKQGALMKLRDMGLKGRHRDDGAAELLEYVRDRSWNREREFLFANLMEAHRPYDPPDEYRTDPDEDPPHFDGVKATLEEPPYDPARIATAYDDAVRYLSDIYRDIYAELAAEFDYIVTLADHGEALGEYGAWEHGSGLYPPVMTVPLVVSAPGPRADHRTPDANGERATRDALVNHLDVYATLLDLAGVETDRRRGESVRPLLSSDPPALEPRSSALAEFHGISRRRRLSLEEDGYEVAPVDTERHALATADCYYFEDLTENRTIGDCDPAALESELDRRVADLERREGLSEADLSGLESQLEELGYL